MRVRTAATLAIAGLVLFGGVNVASADDLVEGAVELAAAAAVEAVADGLEAGIGAAPARRANVWVMRSLRTSALALASRR